MDNSKETIIKANRMCLDLELKEFFKYRDLLFLLIRRDIVTSYKQTILGPLWIVIQALMGSAVFTIIFGNIAGLSTDGHPAFLFYLCGMIGWQYFGGVLGVGSHSLQSNVALFSKVYFPRLIPPVGQSISSLLNFFIQLMVFFIALVIYNQSSTESSIGLKPSLILLPALILQTATLALGLGFIISAMSIKYRDLARISGLFTQFIMYASPVIYPVSEIPQKYQEFMAWNPLTFIIESYRFILLGSSSATNLTFGIPSVASTIVIFLVGLILYNKTQRTFVDFV